MVETVRQSVVAPLTTFREAQERIRKRVKEDLRQHLSAYDEMRGATLPRVRAKYERKCEEVEQLRAQQQAIEDQRTLLSGGSIPLPPPKDHHHHHREVSQQQQSPALGFQGAGGDHGSSSANDAALLSPQPNSSASHYQPSSAFPHTPGRQASETYAYQSSASSYSSSSPPPIAIQGGARGSMGVGGEAGSSAVGSFSPPTSYSSSLPRSETHEREHRKGSRSGSSGAAGGANGNGSGGGGAGGFFESLRHKEGWDAARKEAKEAPKKINAFLSRMREERGGLSLGLGGSGSGNGSSSGGGNNSNGNSLASTPGLAGTPGGAAGAGGAAVYSNGAPLAERELYPPMHGFGHQHSGSFGAETGGSSAGHSGGGSSGGGGGGGGGVFSGSSVGHHLHPHRELSVGKGAANAAQQLSVKFIKAKRESEELDRAYRKAIFDVETLRIRRDKTVQAAIQSCIECKRELAYTAQASWLQAERAGLLWSGTTSSLKTHAEEVALHSTASLDLEIARFESSLPHPDDLTEDKATYVNL